MLSIRAIIFDWAGVFCSPGEPFSHPELTKQTGLTVDEMGAKTLDIQNKYYTNQIQGDEFWNQILKLFKLKSLTPTNLNIAYLASYAISPKMLELAATLKNKYQTMLLSNLTAEMMEDIIKKFAVKNYFHHTIFSNEVGLMKPDPAIFRLANERLGVPTSQTIFIDDSQTNIRVAKTLGFQIILFKNHEQCLNELKQLEVGIL